MLLWESFNTDPAELRRLAASCSSDPEIFVRDDGKGAVVLCSNAAPGDRPNEKKVRMLFNGGQFGTGAGEWLFCVGLWTPQDFREEFLAWYKVEHLPMLLQCPTWDGCRFVERDVEDGCQFYALHQLSDKAALDSDARMRSRSTPWFKRLAKNGWFDTGFKRTLCRRLP